MSVIALTHRLLQAHQLIVTLVLMGIVLCVTIWLLYDRYESVMAFLKEDGLLGKYSMWLTKQQRAKRESKGICPIHGGMPLAYAQKCPVKDCQYIGSQKH